MRISNCNFILFTKLSWPEESELTSRSSSQATSYPLVYHQDMVWNKMKDGFSIFHFGNFLPFHFLSILKFSSIFHSVLPYQGKFRPEATRSLYSTFVTFSVLLQVVAHEGKQDGTMHSQPAKSILQTEKKFKRKKMQQRVTLNRG